MTPFNGTTCKTTVLEAHESKASRVDEVAIWNRSLSVDEIRNHYMRGAANLTLQTRTGSYYENVKNSAEPNFNTLATSAEVASRSNPRRVLSLHFTPNPVNSSQVLDDSGKGNHGTITGAHFSEGKLGSAMVFDGVNDYIAVEVRE